MTASNRIDLGSLLVAVFALFVAWYAIKRANKTTSASTMVALNEGFRNRWDSFFRADDVQKGFELAELLNLLEIACAVCLEGSLSGNSAILMTEYLDNVLRHLIDDSYTKTHVESLLQGETTFIFIKKFLKSRRNTLSVTVPPRWYEL